MCIEAQCRTDADCEGEARCMLSRNTDACQKGGVVACQTPTDVCDGDAACGGEPEPSDCVFDGNWVCDDMDCDAIP
jgi:hypothetical protein